MKIVLDTNVIVSALLNSHGVPAKIFGLVLNSTMNYLALKLPHASGLLGIRFFSEKSVVGEGRGITPAPSN
jgi:hypothetical protein